MRRSTTVKFPNSIELFKFCQKVLTSQRNTRVNDQEVGEILDFNPSDCSHWKRGERNVRSVFALAKLAEVLQVEQSLVHDVASGAVDLDEAFYEYQESRVFKEVLNKAISEGAAAMREARVRVESFIKNIHAQCEFTTPPLYLPEILRLFSFITTQPADVVDKLSRILRLKPNQYCIQFRKGDLKPQTRMSMIRDLAKIVFEGERARFPELGSINQNLAPYEQLIFISGLLAPKALILQEISKLDSRRNIVSELATLFWVPKSLISFQLQDILRSGERRFETSLGQKAEAVLTTETAVSA